MLGNGDCDLLQSLYDGNLDANIWTSWRDNLDDKSALVLQYLYEGYTVVNACNQFNNNNNNSSSDAAADGSDAAAADSSDAVAADGSDAAAADATDAAAGGSDAAVDGGDAADASAQEGAADANGNRRLQE